MLVVMVTSISHVYSPARRDSSEQKPKTYLYLKLPACSFYIFNGQSAVSSTSITCWYMVWTQKRSLFSCILDVVLVLVLRHFPDTSGTSNQVCLSRIKEVTLHVHLSTNVWRVTWRKCGFYSLSSRHLQLESRATNIK